VRQTGQKVAVIFGNEAVIAGLRDVVVDVSNRVEERREAVELLVQKRRKDFVPPLIGLLDDSALRIDALRGLAAYGDRVAAEAILAHFAKFNDAEKADA